MRPRRKSFYVASKRIKDNANATLSLSQSAISEVPSKRTPPKRLAKTTPSPVRSSARLKGIDPTISDSNVPSKRQKRTNNSISPKNVANEIDGDHLETNYEVNDVPANAIPPCRSVTICLDRLSPETIKRYLKGSKPPPRRFSTSHAEVASGSVTAKKVLLRRCTVNLERMDLSQINALPTIREAESENEADLIEPVIDHDEPEETDSSHFEVFEDDLSERNEPSPDMEMSNSEDDFEYDGHNDELQENVPFIDENMNAIVEKSPEIMLTGTTTTFYESNDDDDMSSEISDQNLQSPLHESTALQAMDYHSDESRESSISLSRMDLDADDESSAHASEASTYFSLAVQPVNNQPILSSQTHSYISWNVNRSISSDDDSLAVGYPTTSNENLSEVAEPLKRGFIDSPYVSYGAIIKFKTIKFAVNCFDHNDKSIKLHFLSKFCRNHLSALNKDFTGYLLMSETTARLLSKYSKIDHACIKILEYDRKYRSGCAEFTAIEAKNFPGGALFLFESDGEKSIIHVGDLRLTSELDANPCLINSKIDEVRFDESILSQLFYNSSDCTDRYLDLMDEIDSFVKASVTNGLSCFVAVGAFEIGMEVLLLRLATNFNRKIYMDDERREFLYHMEFGDDFDTTIQKLRQEVICDPTKAFFHVFPVDQISNENLLKYTSEHNYHRVLGIRPRGCDIALQTVVDGTYKIVDIPNPLIGDIEEFERFVKVNVQKGVIEPSGHGASNRLNGKN